MKTMNQATCNSCLIAPNLDAREWGYFHRKDENISVSNIKISDFSAINFMFFIHKNELKCGSKQGHCTQFFMLRIDM